MSQAYVEYDPSRFGIRMAVALNRYDDRSEMLVWSEPVATAVDRVAVAPDEAWLRLDDDVARAIFEALGRHFGGSPDAVTQRADYMAERKRVDQFITYLTTVAR